MFVIFADKYMYINVFFYFFKEADFIFGPVGVIGVTDYPQHIDKHAEYMTECILNLNQSH